MPPAQAAERLQHRRVRPGPLDGGGGAAPGAPAPPVGERQREVEHGGLAHARRSGEQQRAAAAVLGALQVLPDPVADGAAAHQPGALRVRRRLGEPLLQRRPQLLRLPGRDGAQLVPQRLVHPLEVPQRPAYVAPVGAVPGQRQVGLLVGRLLRQELLPPAGLPEQVQVQDPHDLAARLGPRLVGVVGQQRTAVRLERPWPPPPPCPRPAPAGRRAPARAGRCSPRRPGAAPPPRCAAPRRRARRPAPGGRSGRPCAAAVRPPPTACRARAPRPPVRGAAGGRRPARAASPGRRRCGATRPAMAREPRPPEPRSPRAA